LVVTAFLLDVQYLKGLVRR